MDRRRFNGGNKNAGRKPKEEEIKLIERLDKHIDSSKPFKIELNGKPMIQYDFIQLLTINGKERWFTKVYNSQIGKIL